MNPPLNNEPVFRLSGLRFSYGSKVIFDGLSLEVESGEFVGLIGPNGAGKSTLLSLLTGLLRPNAGKVEAFGRPLAAWHRRDFAKKIGVILQREEFHFPYLVRDIIAMGRFAHRTAWVGFDSEEDQRIVESVAERCTVADFLDRPIDTLSGGERQRVLLARALAQCPDVLILDEPTSALDIKYQREMLQLLATLNKGGMTTIAVLHDLNLAARFCRRLIGIGLAGVTFDGTTESVYTAENLSNLFDVKLEVRQLDGALHSSLNWNSE